MDSTITKTLGLKLAQIAWVVKDIETTLRFFQDGLGLNFSKVETIRVKEFGATYYGEPSDAESLVAMAFSGGTFIELIQPVSGNSIFMDYIDGIFFRNGPNGFRKLQSLEHRKLLEL